MSLGCGDVQGSRTTLILRVDVDTGIDILLQPSGILTADRILQGWRSRTGLQSRDEDQERAKQPANTGSGASSRVLVQAPRYRCR
ncbi:MAG: hypothetical protein IH881_14855 [Myxococcales bacterium]|nr:hypothetical protein [Myxococcales bacterium]MCH7868973.1 hypothetical protein [Myxococcales bacterium]